MSESSSHPGPIARPRVFRHVGVVDPNCPNCRGKGLVTVADATESPRRELCPCYQRNQATARTTLTLPFPPSVNTYWRHVKGRTLISKEGRQYRVDVIGTVLRSRCVTFPDQVLNVDIVAWLPDNRRRDVDNLLKAPLDAMAHAHVYEDDSQIADLRIRRGGVDRGNPRLEIILEAA